MTAVSRKKAEAKPMVEPSGLGLSSMGSLSALLDTPVVPAKTGGPLRIALGLIDEDPDQPRTADNPGFGAESLRELASSIRPTGIKSPISLRDNPAVPGRYLINHGARRFRATRLLGHEDIPAFIDNDYQQADQVIENLQRNELTAREIADYIGRELARGLKKGDIARALGKSPSFVSQHVTLLNLPEPIAQAFSAQRITDVTVVNELVTIHRKAPDTVDQWLDIPEQEITRGSVRLLREFVESRLPAPEDAAELAHEAIEASLPHEASVVTKPVLDRPDHFKRAIVLVRVDGTAARLVLDRRPEDEKHVWVKFEDTGESASVLVEHIVLTGLLEG